MNAHRASSRFGLCAGLLLMLPGCQALRAVHDTVFPSVATRQVFLLSASDEIRLTTGDIDEPYEEIAIIAVHDYDEEALEPLNDRLREEARALGADAVIRIDYDLSRAGGEAYHIQSATGTAVRLVPENGR